MAASWFARNASAEVGAQAVAFVRHLVAPPPADEVRWLQGLGVAPEVARREVGWAIRAVGLIVAARDALDDRTAAQVSHALGRALVAGDPVGGATGGWGERMGAYLEAHAARGTGETVARRLAGVLLQGAGVTDALPDALEQAGALVTRHRVRLNTELGRAFGVASLPDDLPPSALRQ